MEKKGSQNLKEYLRVERQYSPKTITAYLEDVTEFEHFFS